MARMGCSGETVAGAAGSRAPERVDRDALERHLARVASTIEDPRGGLFGTRSKIWEINREAVLFLGGARAALLQLAHPYVAEAIHQHSETRSDPFGRFRRTFAHVFAMVFGDLESALRAARQVHGVHRRIHGTFSETVGPYRAGSRYCANEPHALMWVHATLWESSVHVFERTVRRMRAAEKEQYYRETRRFAHLFGIDDELLPADWSGFEAYNREMWASSRLSIGRHAREIGGFLFEPHLPGSAPLMRWLRLMTAGLMPEGLREGFGLGFTDRDRRVYERSLRALRRTRRLWPRRLRYVPPYLSALRRIAGNTRRDRLGEALTRLWIGSVP